MTIRTGEWESVDHWFQWTPEKAKQWQETLDRIHEQQRAADRDRHKIMIGVCQDSS